VCAARSRTRARCDRVVSRSLPLSALVERTSRRPVNDSAAHGRSFADLDIARVGERFNKQALVLQRIARGELFELDGQRDLNSPRVFASCVRRGHARRAAGFLRSAGAGDDRAEAAAHRVRRRLGVDAVVVRHCARSGPETVQRWCRGFAEERHPRRRAVPGQMRARRRPRRSLVGGGATARRKRHPVVMGVRGFLSEAPRRCCSRTNCAARSSGTRDRGRCRALVVAQSPSATCRSCSCRARHCYSPPSRAGGGSRDLRLMTLYGELHATRASASSTGRVTPKSSPPKALASVFRIGAHDHHGFYVSFVSPKQPGLRSAHGLRDRDLDRRRRRPRRGPRSLGRAPRRTPRSPEDTAPLDDAR